MATQAGHRMSISSGRTRRTSGSGGTSGGPGVTMTGCTERTSRAGPQCGRSKAHSAWISAAAPTIDEQRRPCRSARSANATMASGVAATVTRLAPE